MTPTVNQISTQTGSVKIELPSSLLHDRRFLFNRELSWLEFNRRVLEEALDEAAPTLERLKFLAIFATNLDEFFMIRVSGLKEQIAEGIAELSADGMTAGEQLREIRNVLSPMLAEQMLCLREEILPQLAEKDVVITPYKDLTDAEKNYVNRYFTENVFPILTPQAVDISHPFPYISNLSLNLGVMIEPKNPSKNQPSEARFARIKMPASVSRLVRVSEYSNKFTLLGELIAANVNRLFVGMRTSQCFLFRVTRDADIEIREDEAGDLLRTMELELKQRKRLRSAVRLEISASMPSEMVRYLANSLQLTESDIYRIDGFLNVPDLMQFYGLDIPELKDKPILTTTPNVFRRAKSIFDVLKQRDILLHHPYTAYSSVTDFINAAANDPEVLAIKICLYRTGKDSPIVKALMKASEEGKQVTALVELKARFDEENNIEWARKLESEGVHVVYGMRGLKTHCKLALVVRRESGKLKRYVHIATGNYNPTTSRIYTDLGLLTSDDEIGADATDLFNYLTSFSNQVSYRSLIVAPVNLRERFVQMIRREAKNQRAGKPSRIIIKSNSLTDIELIHELYLASQAGVQIDLIIRGICALRPEISGISENIRVRSVVGRFLEHSRIFYFANGGEEEIYIGSADWMRRNLDNRVEVVTPIRANPLKQHIKEEILGAYLQDAKNARILHSDGTYQRIRSDFEINFDSQMFFVGQDI